MTAYVKVAETLGKNIYTSSVLLCYIKKLISTKNLHKIWSNFDLNDFKKITVLSLVPFSCQNHKLFVALNKP